MSITQRVHFVLSTDKSAIYFYGEGNLPLTTYSGRKDQERGPIFQTERKYSLVIDSNGHVTIQERF